MSALPTQPSEFTYQRFIRQKIIARRKTGIIMRPGGGKTRPIIEALVELGCIVPNASVEGRFPLGPILVLCSGPAIGTWSWQIPHWANASGLAEDIFIATGDTQARRELWTQARLTCRGIYITNASCFRNDETYIYGKTTVSAKPGAHWAALIADEYHKYMRTRKSAVFRVFSTVARHVNVVVPLTGSGISKNPASMWTLFYICDPKLPIFRSYWRFAKAFCHVDDFGYGPQLYGARNVEGFKKIMDRYVAYVPDEVVADELPQGLRSRMAVGMDIAQRRAYDTLNKEMILELEGSITVASTIMGKLVLLRRLLCVPAMVDPSLGWGAGLEAIGDTLDTQDHIAVFVPFRAACDLVRDYLAGLGHECRILRGQISLEEQQETVEWFRRERGIIVCTIAYAESFDLETCDTSFFLGYDIIGVDQNKQAEGRTQRAISEHKFVRWNYVYYPHTVDDHFLEMFNTDHEVIKRVLDRPQEFIRMLKGAVTSS